LAFTGCTVTVVLPISFAIKMKLTHLRDITAVAERGSLRAAARQLGVAQPAITRSIREIEHELGVALFERRPKGMVLTPMGELFVRRAITVLGEIQRAREEIDQTRGMTSGHVSIALSSAAQISLFPHTLEPFRKRYPNVSLNIRDGLFPTIENVLKDGEIDFYVGPLPEHVVAKEFIVEKLFDNTRVILGRHGHPLSKARSLSDLVDARWIGTSVTVDRAAELGPLFERYGLSKPAVDVIASGNSVTLAAASSDLLIMVPEQWLDFFGATGHLTLIQVKEPLPAPPICIVTRARLPLTPAAEFFADLFRRAALYYLRARRDRKKQQRIVTQGKK
jgi:DNA-binding transcriptional LysR family regulator